MKALTEEIPRMLFSSDEVDGVIIHGIMDTGFIEMLHPAMQRFVKLDKKDLIKMVSIRMDELVSMPGRFGKPLLISSFFGKEDHCMQTFHEHLSRRSTPGKTPGPWGVPARLRIGPGLGFTGRRTVPPRVRPDRHTVFMQAASRIQRQEALRAYGVPTAREALAVGLDRQSGLPRRSATPCAQDCSPAVTPRPC
jgi:acetyltransferase